MGGTEYKKESLSRRNKKKRKGFHGTPRAAKPSISEEPENIHVEREGLSASASKIDMSFYENVPSSNGDDIVDYECMYMFMDIKILMNLFELFGKSCPECSEKLWLTIDHEAKLGLAQKIMVLCQNKNCEFKHHTYSSFKASSTSSRYDVNLRSVIAFREIGRGHQHIQTFNRIMNMLPPFSHSNYDETVKELLPNYLNEMKKSMLAVADNVKNQCELNNCDNDIELNDDSVLFSVNVDFDNDINATNTSNNDNNTTNNDTNTTNDTITDCDVSIDGSWQRRGHASLNGFVSAIERVTDKIIDVDVMTKDCRSCKYWSGKESEAGYDDWVRSHKCSMNHDGSSGSMESEGAIRIFNRSIANYKLRYVNYIGDGDSSAYKKVKESNPYSSDDLPRKLECVGHIQKRVGTGLLKLVKQNKGIGGRGKGKLTKQVINTLHNYYGIAIRNNKGKTLPEMKAAIAAVILHCVEKEGVSDDKRHKFCL